MESKVRIKTLQDGPRLEQIIKCYVQEEPSKSTGLWKTDDIEDAIENFNGFLCAVARENSGLSKSFLLRHLKKLFKTDHVTLEDFAGKLTQSLRYCRSKGKSCTSGKKTSQACLNVIKTYDTATSHPASSKSSQELEGLGASLPTDGDEVCEVGSEEDEECPSDLVEESGCEDDEALAALKAAEGMYQSYGGSAAASSLDVVDLTDGPSPMKSSQVPHIPDEVCTNLIKNKFSLCARMAGWE